MSQDSNLPASLSDSSLATTKLIGRAIRKKWPIPADKREALIDRQIAIATSETVSPRESTAAFKAVLAAEAQNIAVQKTKRPKLIDRNTIFVPGNLEESKRRAIAYLDQIVSQRAAGEAVSQDDA